MSRHHLPCLVLALACWLLFLGACDTSVEAFDRETGLYSIHGILSLSKDTHYVRIKNLNEPIPADSSRGLNATVTFENLDTGSTETLGDSVVSFNGIYTHNFRVLQDIQPETRYRVTVERSDGESASAVATMPPITQVEVSGREPIKCQYGPSFDFLNVPHARLVEIAIGIPWNGTYHWIRRDPEVQSGFRIYKLAERVLPRRITATLDSTRWCTHFSDDDVLVAYAHYGPDWPPDSVRTNPVASTVNNGLGLFGGVHRDTFRVQVDTSSVH